MEIVLKDEAIVDKAFWKKKRKETNYQKNR
jgi:hypothetical protein